jgi:hypothetical protein
VRGAKVPSHRADQIVELGQIVEYDKRYQEQKNGPLTKDLRDRITKFRSFYTLAEIGETLEFSGPFVSQLLNEKTPARVDSKHIPRIVKALEEAEARDAKKLGLDEGTIPSASTPKHENTSDYHLRAIDKLGWKILGIALK